MDWTLIGLCLWHEIKHLTYYNGSWRACGSLDDATQLGMCSGCIDVAWSDDVGLFHHGVCSTESTSAAWPNDAAGSRIRRLGSATPGRMFLC
jgi:hypothetical protein